MKIILTLLISLFITSTSLFAAYDHKVFLDAKAQYEKFLKYKQANYDKFSMKEWKDMGHPYTEVLQQTYYLDKSVTYTGQKRLKKGIITVTENPIQHRSDTVDHRQKLVAKSQLNSQNLQSNRNTPRRQTLSAAPKGPSFQHIASSNQDKASQAQSLRHKRVQKLLSAIPK